MTLCKDCKKILNDITGIYKVEKGHVCEDCYYSRFDEELDNHPIGGHKRIIRRPQENSK